MTRTRNKFHLFPEQIVHLNEEWWVQGSFTDAGPLQADEEGRRWFEGPDLIAIVRPKKQHTCDLCRATIKVERSQSWLSRFRIISRDLYVGISDNCYPPYWGYDTKICLRCALKIFRDAKVYRCEGFDDLWHGGWYAEAPKIDRPALDLGKIIEAILPKSEGAGDERDE